VQGLLVVRTVVAMVVAVVLLSGSSGRAHPTGGYRPDLPPAALTNGCWPLPAGVVLDFPHQVRTDGDLGDPPRRQLVLQFDVIDADTARAELREAFLVAGFADSRDDREQLVFERPGFGTVSALVTPLPGAEDFVVRGTIVLDLPVSAPSTSDPVCDQPSSTKRFTAAAGS
jgi:hypothetical protein